MHRARDHSLFIAVIEGSGVPFGQAVAHSPVNGAAAEPIGAQQAQCARTRGTYIRQTRSAFPGTELWVRARLDVRSEADLALQN